MVIRDWHSQRPQLGTRSIDEPMNFCALRVTTMHCETQCTVDASQPLEYTRPRRKKDFIGSKAAPSRLDQRVLRGSPLPDDTREVLHPRPHIAHRALERVPRTETDDSGRVGLRDSRSRRDGSSCHRAVGVRCSRSCDDGSAFSTGSKLGR
jgi:hypothetical protein